jgi:hypothetical protein
MYCVREYEEDSEKYDDALREEVKLLTFKAPNDAEGPDIAAAKQFLNTETIIEGDLILYFNALRLYRLSCSCP